MKQQSWIKNVAVFMTSQALSIFGSDIVYWGIYWYIVLKTNGSGLYTTLIIIAGFVPTMFLSPFAGVWADRYNKKYLINISDASIAVVTLIMAITFMFGYKEIWLLLLTLAIRTIGGSVQTPCVGAILPDIVDKEHLTKVNGINSALQAIIKLVAPVTAGRMLMLIPKENIEYLFFIDIFTALIAITVLGLFLKVPKKTPEELALKPKRTGYFDEIKQGVSYIAKNRFLKHFFIYFPIVCIMAAPVAFLTPNQATRFYNASEQDLSLVQGALCLGMIIGGLVISIWGGFKNRVHTVILAGVLLGVMTISLGFPNSSTFYLYLLPICFCGIALPLFNTSANVILQERVDPNYLGRMFSVTSIMSSSMMPLGMLIFGPVSDIPGMQIEWLMIFSGIVILIISVIISRDKPVLEAGTKIKNEDLSTKYKD